MSAEYDATEFVDSDFQAAAKAGYPGAAANRAPSREEVDSKVGETQQKLAELKRVQEELERERAGLEETRRRQMEFQKGREETIQGLTRAIGLLTESEFKARCDAELMTKFLADLQAALMKVESTNEQAWTKDNFSTELTRGLTVIENARHEWSLARQKFPILSGITEAEGAPRTPMAPASPNWMAGQSLGQLCKLGLALTWPLAVAVVFVGCLLILFLKR